MNCALSDGEWKLMKLLWDSSPLTIGDMVKSLSNDTGWNKNTIFVMLGRLEAKGAVISEEGKGATGRSVRLYSPIIEHGEATLEETDNFLKRVYNGSLTMLVSSLADQKKLSENDLAELRRIIDEAEEKL